MKLVQVDKSKIKEKVTTVFNQYPQIVGAYLFGSTLGKCRPDSDIDIGVFIDRKINEKKRDYLAGELAIKLEPIDGHPFDINVVLPGETIFAYRIISEGTLIYVSDQNRMRDLVEQVSREYAEKGYRYRKALEEIREEG